MLHFLHQIINPLAVTMLFIWVYCLFGLAWDGYPGVRTGVGSRAYGSIIPFICFLVVTVVAFIAWAFIVFA